MEKMLTYDETLDILERFMLDSGLRAFCESRCKGVCCNACFYSKNACHKHGGRRLSCSAFLCMEIEHLIFPNKTTMGRFSDINIQIRSAIRKTGYSKNEYFYPHSEKTRSQFRLPESIISQGLPPAKFIAQKIEALDFLLGKISKNQRR